jgi:hypothetical protein
MLDLDLPVLRRNGDVMRLTQEGLQGAINLPMLATELYRSARWLRVFVARPVRLDADAVKKLARLPAAEVRDRVARGGKLLAN